MTLPVSLMNALPELQQAWTALEAQAAAIGGSFTLNEFGGLRTEADTTLIEQYRETDYQAAVASGAIRPDTTLQQFRPIAPWGRSYHDFGAAFDVTAHGITQAQLGALAPACGLRWGGTWSNPDPSHFELDMTLAEASAKWQNWVASGEQSDTLTTTQQVEVVAQDPKFWTEVAALAYAGFVVYRAVFPKWRKWSHETA